MAVEPYRDYRGVGHEGMVPMDTSRWMLPQELAPQWGAEPLRTVDPESDENTNILRLLVQSWRLVLGCAAVGSALAAIFVKMATPRYSSEATIRMGWYSPVMVGAEIENLLRQQSMELSYRKTQIAQLGSLTVADLVFADQKLGERIKQYLSAHPPGLAGFLGLSKKYDATPVDTYRTPVEYLSDYLNLVKISPVRETTLVRVRFETTDPELSRTLANAHSEAFINDMRQDQQAAIVENSAFLERQANELQQKVADAERRVAIYARDHKLFALTNEEGLLTRKIQTLSEQHARAMTDRITVGSLLDEVKNDTEGDSTLLDDESIRTLRTSLKAAEADYALLRSRFTPNYPEAAQALARIVSLRKTLAQQRRQSVAALEAKYKSALQTEAQLGEQIEKQKTSDQETSRRLVEYNTLQREYRSLKDLHQSVLRQLKAMQIAGAGTASNVVITDQAVVSTEPSSPKGGVAVILCTALGLVVGAGIAVLRQLCDHTMTSSDEVMAAVRVPALGTVPHFSDSDGASLSGGTWIQWARRKGGELIGALSDRGYPVSSAHALCAWVTPKGVDDTVREVMTVGEPSSIEAEAFRTIRTSLLLSSADTPPHTVLVTSSHKGEGKTTVAANLAIVLAQAGHRTVVVDTDVRSPGLRERFAGGRPSIGLVEYLAGQVSLEDVLFETVVPGLWCIATGSAAPNPAELVGSRKMAELVRMLANQFDHVILDAPPVLPVADSLMMSRCVDGVILVTRIHHTEKRAVREAMQRLHGVRAPVLGVVVTGVTLDKTQWSGYSRPRASMSGVSLH